MRAPRSIHLILATACAVAVLSPALLGQSPQQRRAIPRDGGWQTAPNRNAYDLGFREGASRGERDGRDGREFDYERDGVYRSADRGYERRYGDRNAFRNEFRRGFAAGYRSGYERYRRASGNRRDDRGWGGRAPRGYQEPAAARGYSDGYEKGLDDGRDRDRYDPVRHGDYRSGDEGYYREYGSRDAYRNNYRAGFRQGYEDGYRDGAARRR
jgi:hypothetical protein